MMAGAGSAALAACGGGGGEGTGADSVVNAQAVSKAASASGTVIPPAASITDSSGAVWTLVGGRVTRNGSGVSTGSPAALATILYYNGTIYAKNSSGTWFKNGSPWQNIGTTDPRGVASAAAAATSSKPLFYGINGHLAYGSGIYKTMTAAAQLAILKDLGVTNYRCDVADSGMAKTLAAALTGAFKGSGVSILPVLNPLSCGWNTSLSESSAYTLGYNLATGATTQLKGLVTHIECGNELDVPLKVSGDGSSATNWSPAMWPSLRGVLRGMIDGVRAIDPTIKVGVGTGIPLSYRALQMLWNGVTPNGTTNGASGAASIRWDFTCYHWYESSGDMLCGWQNSQCYDVLQALKDSFGVPIWLTEWGWNAQKDTADQQAAYIPKALAEYYSLRDKYNIESILMYAVVDDNYGLVAGDGVTKRASYNNFKNFVKANPV